MKQVYYKCFSMNYYLHLGIIFIVNRQEFVVNKNHVTLVMSSVIKVENHTTHHSNVTDYIRNLEYMFINCKFRTQKYLIQVPFIHHKSHCIVLVVKKMTQFEEIYFSDEAKV